MVWCAPSGRQPIRLEVRCDKGTFPCTLQLDPWEGLTPLALSVPEFLAARQVLGGFNETVSSVPLPASASVPVPGGDRRKELMLRVRKLLNVFPVNAPPAAGLTTHSETEEEYMFAGSIRKGTGMAEDKLLISLRADGYANDNILYCLLSFCLLNIISHSIRSPNSNVLHIRINTEDAMMGASLSDTLKKSFLASR